MIALIVMYSVMGAAAGSAAKEPYSQKIATPPAVAEKESDWLFTLALILGGIFFCAPWFALIYLVVRIAFKVNGVTFP